MATVKMNENSELAIMVGRFKVFGGVLVIGDYGARFNEGEYVSVRHCLDCLISEEGTWLPCSMAGCRLTDLLWCSSG